MRKVKNGWVDYETELFRYDHFFGEVRFDLDEAQRILKTRITRKRVLIKGGESGPGARPCDLAWIRGIVGQCKAAGVPVFVKQAGSKLIDGTLIDLFGPDGKRHYTRSLGDPLIAEAKAKGYLSVPRAITVRGQGVDGWPEDLQVREYPS